MLRLVMPQTVTIVVDVVAWGVFHAATGYAAHRLGDERLSRDGWGLRERRLRGPRPLVPPTAAHPPLEGPVARGGRPVRRRRQQARAARARRRRASSSSCARPAAPSWGTGGRCACSPLFVLWNPPLAAVLLGAYGVLVNLPFIAIQRYNRFRTQALLGRVSRRRSTT